MESLLKNLKEQVTCSICLDTYTKPKTIVCLHTFCCECLEKHALVSQTQGKFLCPECQTEVGIPEGNRFDNLPTSFLHNSLLSLLVVRQTGDGSQISCGICKKKSAEISYCFDCEKLMCPDCVNAHELFQAAAFEGHKVTPVKQFQVRDYEALLKQRSFCSQQYHEREVTRFFCLECQTCVCQICINTDHKNHNVDPLEKAADAEKANIKVRIELMKEKRKVCNDLIREIEETASKLEATITAAKREVSEAADQMIAKIREREREAIDSLENARVSRSDELDCVNKQIQSLTKQIDQAVEFANSLIQGSSSSHIMQSKKNLKQRFEDLNKKAVPALPVGPFVKFVSTIVPESLSLGFLSTSETAARLYTIEVLTQNIQAGLEAEFVIHLRTNDEVMTSEIRVEVFVEPANEVASLIVLENENRNFRVQFIPKVPGTYSITVTVNGDKLVNSPFRVQVKERQLEVVDELDLKGIIPQEPRGIAVNSKGLIAVGDSGNDCVLIFDKGGRFVRMLGYYEETTGPRYCPVGITYLNDDEILVADELNHRIQQFNVQTGNFVKSFGKKGTGLGEFQNPCSICMDGDGRVVVAEFENNRIQVLTKDGKPVFKFGDSGPEKLDQPTGCIYYKNMFIVSDSFNHCLKIFDKRGKFLNKIGEKGGADGQISLPWGLCIDKFASLLVCDRSNGRIVQFTVEGHFSGKTVLSKIGNPRAIISTPDGRILVSDWTANKIYVLK